MKRTSPILVCLMLALFCTATAFAQNPREVAERNLIETFRDRLVSLKMDMPATDKGVDIFAGKTDPIDREKYQRRLRTYGTAIKTGDPTIITRIVVRKDEICFELAGGGAPESVFRGPVGTMPVSPQSNTITSSARSRQINNAPTTARQAAAGTVQSRDADHARSIINYETSKRERADADARAGFRSRSEYARDAASQMGSRFVIKFEKKDTASVTPYDVMKILENYISF